MPYVVETNGQRRSILDDPVALTSFEVDVKPTSGGLLASSFSHTIQRVEIGLALYGLRVRATIVNDLSIENHLVALLDLRITLLELLVAKVEHAIGVEGVAHRAVVRDVEGAVAVGGTERIAYAGHLAFDVDGLVGRRVGTERTGVGSGCNGVEGALERAVALTQIDEGLAVDAADIAV